MNTFYAHYTNMDNNDEIIRMIEFDYMDIPEKDIYKMAIDKAFKMKLENECFYMLEMVSLI